MSKSKIVVSWLVGVVAVITVSTLVGYINIILDFVFAFVGAGVLTVWALTRLAEL